MKVQIPDEIFSIQKWECTVKSNRSVATFIKELIVELPAGESINFKSGGYIQIDIPKYKLSYSDFDIEDQYRTDWDKLQPQEKKEEYGKNFKLEKAVKEHGAKNLYKITSRGESKFEKIKNNCLDRDTQIIMGIPYSEGEDKDYMGSAGTKDIDE